MSQSLLFGDRSKRTLVQGVPTPGFAFADRRLANASNHNINVRGYFPDATDFKWYPSTPGADQLSALGKQRREIERQIREGHYQATTVPVYQPYQVQTSSYYFNPNTAATNNLRYSQQRDTSEPPKRPAFVPEVWSSEEEEEEDGQGTGDDYDHAYKRAPEPDGNLTSLNAKDAFFISTRSDSIIRTRFNEIVSIIETKIKLAATGNLLCATVKFPVFVTDTMIAMTPKLFRSLQMEFVGNRKYYMTFNERTNDLCVSWPKPAQWSRRRRRTRTRTTASEQKTTPAPPSFNDSKQHAVFRPVNTWKI